MIDGELLLAERIGPLQLVSSQTWTVGRSD